MSSNKKTSSKEKKIRFQNLANRAKILKKNRKQVLDTPESSRLLNLPKRLIPLKVLTPPSNTYDWRSLSIKQPWAQLIVDGIKTVENRTNFSNDYNEGRWIFLHASKTGDNIEKVLNENVNFPNKYVDANAFYQGYILGCARIEGVYKKDELNVFDRKWAHDGDNCIIFDIVIKFTAPVKFQGNVGLVVVNPSENFVAPKLNSKQLKMSNDELKISRENQRKRYFKTRDDKQIAFSEIQNQIKLKQYSITYIRNKLFNRLNMIVNENIDV